MASRSLKPASYLASQPAKRSPRPSFARSSSASSSKSNTSEDFFVTSLRSMSTTDNAPANKDTDSSETGGASPRCHTPINHSSLSHQAFDDTPGRKRSRPITIEPPSRSQPVYTPLTARGELKGGYFPFHDNFSRHYNSSPATRDEQGFFNQQNSQPPSPYNMSNASSTVASPAEANRRVPASILSPAFNNTLPLPEALTMPLGKYHPSNYKAPAKSPTSAPTMPQTNISLPSTVPDRKKKRSGHERQASDVKRKLQEYQMGQARNAAMLASLHGGSDADFGSKPVSPRLAPLGSPGPITPFELEESGGYVVAGASRSMAHEGLLGLGGGRDHELVGRMIRAEEERRVMGAKEGSRSPVLRV